MTDQTESNKREQESRDKRDEEYAETLGRDGLKEWLRAERVVVSRFLGNPTDDKQERAIIAKRREAMLQAKIRKRSGRH